MATLQSLTVDLGMDNRDLLSGLQRARKAVSSFQRDVGKSSRRLSSMADAMSRLAKPVSLLSLASAGRSLVSALQPAAGALLALPAAGAATAAGMATVKTATAGLGTAMEALASGSAEDVAKAMEDLSPEAREFARSLHGVTDGFGTVRRAVQEEVFAGLSERVDRLGSRYLPELEDGMSGVGGVANDMAKSAADAVDTPFFQGVVSQTFDTTAESLQAFEPTIAPVTRALGNLVDAGLPMVQQFADWASKGLEAKAGFLASAEGAEWLSTKINDGVATLRTLGNIASNVGDAISGIFAASGDSAGLLATIETLTAKFADWVTSTEGQAQISELFTQLEQFSQAVLDILPLVTGALMQMVTWFNELPDPVKSAVGSFLAWSAVLGPIVSKIAPVISGITKLTTRLITAAVTPGTYATKFGKAFGRVAAAAGKGAGKVAAAAGKISGKMAALAAKMMARAVVMAASWIVAMGPIGWIIAAVVGLVALIIANWDKVKKWTINAWNATVDWVSNAWDWIVDAVSDGVGNVIDWVKSLPGKIGNALGNLGGLLLEAGKDIMRGLLDGINAAWGWVQDKLSWITDMIPDWKGPIQVDAKLLEPAGRAIMGGLQAGIDGEQADLHRQLQDVTSTISTSIQPVAKTAARKSTVELHVTGGDEQMLQLIRSMIRVRGGDAQTVLGSGG